MVRQAYGDRDKGVEPTMECLVNEREQRVVRTQRREPEEVLVKIKVFDDE